VSNKQIIENLFLLDKCETSTVLRCIMVRGINTDEYNFNAIADTYKRLKNCIGVELLPYHPYGSSKNEQLGLGNNARIDWIPQKEELETSKDRLEQLGVKVINK
jgi:pyruvate-formate lyase-activating enzyme